jgi:NitT/TauT family transport system substrate-binding protein
MNPRTFPYTSSTPHRRVWPGLALAAALGGLGVGCGGDQAPSSATPGSPPAKRVTLGIQVSPAMALVMIAKDRNLFKKIDVEIKEFTAGKFALQSQLGGAIDYCVSGEVPVCLATLQGNPLRTVAQVVEKTSNEVRAVARRDGDLNTAEAYFKARKRKLATSFGGGPEYYTYEFLKKYNISPDQVEVISQKPEDMPAALATGSVDAIAVFDPFAFIAEKRLGDQALTFTGDELYSEFYVLNARPEQIEHDGDTIRELIRGLARAAEFAEKDPSEAKKIVQRYTKLDPEVIEGIWKNFVFRPALTPDLIRVWEAEADWAVATKKVPEGTARPDFRKVVVDRFLRDVQL